MIKGISVIITTYNHLEYLKKCLYSIKKYSMLPDTEYVLFVDGSTDGTFEWLEENNIPHYGRKKQKGCWSGWNAAAKHVKNKYLMYGEDDEFFGPQWDFKLADWIRELGDNYVVMPQLVEPGQGSYDYYDCGQTIDVFDEQKFFDYVYKKWSTEDRKTIPNHMGFETLTKEMFDSIGGFDDFYDPFSRGGADFKLRLAQKYPNLRWIRVSDSMIYHFPPSLHRNYAGWPNFKEIRQRNIKYFQERFGMTVAQAFETIPVGVK